MRSPRLTWSDTSSKSARPANDFESCETVSIAESAQCPLVRCPAQLVNHESTRMNTNRRCSGGCVSRKPLTSADSSPVNSVGPYIEGRHPRTINPEYDAQIGFDHSGIDRVLGSFSAVSIETNRCFLKSSSASMKSCGISADLRMHCTSRSRSVFGNASISLRICSAVI